MPLGRYVVIEGDEGSGKGTQVGLLAEHLSELGIANQVVREPGGDPVAEQLREILKFSEHPIVPLAEVFGFLMARVQVLELVVKPLLVEGTWVLSDRSTLSTIVYQGVMRGLIEQNREGFLAACQLAQLVEPDLTVVLDIPLETSAARIASRGEETDRFESAGDENRRKINDGYREWTDGVKYHLIPGTGQPSSVHNLIWAQVEPLLTQGGA